MCHCFSTLLHTFVLYCNIWKNASRIVDTLVFFYGQKGRSLSEGGGQFNYGQYGDVSRVEYLFREKVSLIWTTTWETRQCLFGLCKSIVKKCDVLVQSLGCKYTGNGIHSSFGGSDLDRPRLINIHEPSKLRSLFPLFFFTLSLFLSLSWLCDVCGFHLFLGT